MIRSLNHENKSRNDDAFDVYEHRFTNIEKMSTFISEIHHNDINILTNK